ncbi:MAG TPA: hypothetical protein VH599_15620 [Ktedonobacterales bacterium]
MVQKSQEASASSSQFSEEHESPEAIKQAHEELQRTIQKLRASDTTAERLLHLLDEWLMDESGYDEATWPKLKAALERDRPSARSLFDE